LIGALYSPDYNHTVVAENKHVGLTLDYRFDHESALNVFFRKRPVSVRSKNIPPFGGSPDFTPTITTTTDTAEKINYTKMAKILRLAYLSGYSFANQPSPAAIYRYPRANSGASRAVPH